MSEGGFLLSRVVGCARVLGTWLMTCSLPRRAVGPGVGKMGAGVDSERWKVGAGKLLRPRKLGPRDGFGNLPRNFWIAAYDCGVG